MKNISVALLGASNTGKTTLASDFAHLNDDFKFVNIQTADRLKQAGFNSHTDLVGGKAKAEFDLKFQTQLANDRHAAYKEAKRQSSVITDRSAIDAWVYHYSVFSIESNADQLNEMEKSMLTLAVDFDLIIKLPYPCLSDADLGATRRVNSHYYHSLTDACYEQFLKQHSIFLGFRVIHMPLHVATANRIARVSWLQEEITTFCKPESNY